MNNDFWSLMKWFAHDFHSWKSWANHPTWPKIVIHCISCIILYIFTMGISIHMHLGISKHMHLSKPYITHLLVRKHLYIETDLLASGLVIGKRPKGILISCSWPGSHKWLLTIGQFGWNFSSHQHCPSNDSEFTANSHSHEYKTIRHQFSSLPFSS